MGVGWVRVGEAGGGVGEVWGVSEAGGGVGEAGWGWGCTIYVACLCMCVYGWMDAP